MTVEIKTVSVTYERKQSLGDYSSANIGCTLWADVSDDEQDLDAVMRGLWEMAKNNVKVQLVPLIQKQSAQVEQIYMGLPLELRQAAKAAMDDKDTDDRFDDLDYGIDPKDGDPFGAK